MTKTNRKIQKIAIKKLEKINKKKYTIDKKFFKKNKPN